MARDRDESGLRDTPDDAGSGEGIPDVDWVLGLDPEGREADEACLGDGIDELLPAAATYLERDEESGCS